MSLTLVDALLIVRAVRRRCDGAVLAHNFISVYKMVLPCSCSYTVTDPVLVFFCILFWAIFFCFMQVYTENAEETEEGSLGIDEEDDSNSKNASDQPGVKVHVAIYYYRV